MTTETALGDRLIQTLTAARTKEEVLIAVCDDTEPTVPGQWTAKDNVAHLSFWRQHAVRALDAIRLGTTLDDELEGLGIDEQNAKIYEAHRNDSAAAVRAASAETHGALIDAVKACTDDQLRTARPGNAGPLWRVVPGNGHAHVAEHLTYWYLDHHDAAAAESAAVWAHALAVELSPDAEDRAVADYNLACFYGRIGRVDAAVPLIRGALQGRPDLRPWAAEDPDLEPIRSHPEINALLAG